ncbi:MAG: hypothetical protein AAGI45_23135, partial [Cyanobacteria bacterium P01_H01_bin.26]
RQGHYVGLGAIALFAGHAISSLVFSVLDLAPSSPNWSLVLTLGSFLAIAGAASGLRPWLPPRLASGGSGAAAVAVLGFYSLGQLGGQQAQWAIAGAVGGLALGGGLGLWASKKQERRFWQAAIALISGLCAYGVAFGLGTWTLAAISTQRWPLALSLGLLTGLYLWLTQRIFLHYV